MKKASILAFQYADNYGALLQIYALKRILNSKNIYVETLDFSPPELVEPYNLNINFQKYRNEWGLLRAIKAYVTKKINYSKNKKNKLNFNQFRELYLNLTPLKYTNTNELINSEEIKSYDYYFVGSDQVWNPDFYKYAKEAYFLEYAPANAKRISYAASISKELNENERLFFSQKLEKFDYVSVREETGRDQIKDFVKNEVHITLDPTLLLSKHEWFDLYKDSNFIIKEDYIFVYNLVTDKVIVELANNLADKYNAKIVCYSDENIFNDILFTFNGCKPQDFLYLLANAKFVVTSSFHGAAFSIALEKDFYTVPHPTRGSRMIDLLVKLDLENNIVSKYNEKHLEIVPINYNKTSNKLNQLRSESLNYIDNVL